MKVFGEILKTYVTNKNIECDDFFIYEDCIFYLNNNNLTIVYDVLNEKEVSFENLTSNFPDYFSPEYEKASVINQATIVEVLKDDSFSFMVSFITNTGKFFEVIKAENGLEISDFKKGEYEVLKVVDTTKENKNGVVVSTTSRVMNRTTGEYKLGLDKPSFSLDTNALNREIVPVRNYFSAFKNYNSGPWWGGVGSFNEYFATPDTKKMRFLTTGGIRYWSAEIEPKKGKVIVSLDTSKKEVISDFSPNNLFEKLYQTDSEYIAIPNGVGVSGSNVDAHYVTGVNASYSGSSVQDAGFGIYVNGGKEIKE